ncbi:MAG: invasion associated locus B family protein, partial [Proteobacteria bacterium]|nr:invasion associated locus B family protein [Pseudomonadota bacterium]
MIGSNSFTGKRLQFLGAAAVAVALSAGSTGAFAQAAKKDNAAPAKAEPAAAQNQSAWVKLCEKAPVLAPGKDGKEEQVLKSICLTHHERLDGNTGMVLVSAAVREVEGLDKKHLMVMVPLGMAIQPGLRAKVFDKAMWDIAQKNEKVDDSKLTPIKLNFSLCHPAGCTAEIELTNELME